MVSFCLDGYSMIWANIVGTRDNWLGQSSREFSVFMPVQGTAPGGVSLKDHKIKTK